MTEWLPEIRAGCSMAATQKMTMEYEPIPPGVEASDLHIGEPVRRLLAEGGQITRQASTVRSASMSRGAKK